MNISSPGSPDISTEGTIQRREVIDAYKEFIAQCIESPDDLDLSNPRVKAANALFHRWITQENLLIQGYKEGQIRNNLSKSMFYVDAGFTDSDYLDEVLGWIREDAQEIEKQNGNTERTQTRKQVAEAIKKIRSLLIQNKL